MEQTSLLADIRGLFLALEEKIAKFNAWWPARFRAGSVWPLPVQARDEPFSLEKPFEHLSATASIAPAQMAIGQLRMLSIPSQSPVTSLRMPGWIALTEPPVAHLLGINAARQALSDRLDTEFAGRDLTARTIETYRARALRAAIPGVSTRHLFRKLHGFDETPVAISFMWVGKSTSHRLTTVAEERKRLRELITRKGRMPPEHVDNHPDLKAIEPYPGDTRLVIVSPNTPHPRVMLFFESRSRWDAMPRANLPIFIHCPADRPLPRVRPLPVFTGESDGRGTRDARTRTLISATRPERQLYLYEPTTQEPTRRLQSSIRSTYGEGEGG